MLEMGGRLAVGSHYGPIVVENTDVGRTHIDHGLNGNGHAWLELRPRACAAVIRHLGFFVQLAPDAVADEFADDAVAVRDDFILDRATEVAQTSSCMRVSDGEVES